MTETEGKGTPSREARGSGTAKGKGGGRDTQTAEGRKKRGSMVPGPPRLENVPGDKLDEVLLFREERPNKTPKVIECYADRYAVVGGRRYVVGHPCDWSVSLCIPKGQDGVEPIPLESDLMQELLPGLQRELEEEDVHLFDTPVTLTLQGDFLAEGEDYDEDDEDDDGDEEQEAQQAGESGGQIDFEVLDQGDGTFDGDPGDEEEVEDRIPTDIEEEGVEHIASYWYEGEEYSLVKHNDPTFVIARQTPDGYLLLGPKEGDMVRPRIEAMMLRELQVTQAVEGALGDDLERELDSAFKKAGGEEADWSKLLPEVDTE